MIILLVGRIFQILLAVLQIRLATTLLSPGQYGVWILIQSVVAFFVMFLLSPVGLYLNRHINEWDNQKILPEVFRAYSIFLVLFSLIGGIFFLIVQKLKMVDFHVTSVFFTAALMSVFMLTQTFHQTWIPALNFIGKRKEYVLGTLLGTLLSLVIVFIFSRLGQNGPELWVISFSLGSILAAFVFIPKDWYKFNRERFLRLKETFKLVDIFQYSSPLFFSTLFIWFQTQGYRFIVEKRVGLETFGQFAAGYAVVAGLFAALEVVISSFYQPNFYKNVSQGSEVSEELKKVWNISLYPYFLATAFLFLLAPDISKIFLHKNFIVSTDWICWVVLAEGLRVIFNVVCVNYHATKKTFSIAWAHFIGTALTLGLFYFVHKLSYLNLLVFLGSGYLVSILLLIGIDHKTFHQSRLFRKFIISAGTSIIYFLGSFFISRETSGPLKIALISILGLVFITPYYLRHVRGMS